MRGCLEICGGSLGWLKTWQHPIDKDGARLGAGCAHDWMTAWRTLEALRTEYLTKTLPKMADGLCLPETLPWGSEQWSCLRNLPQEAAMRDALARCALYHPSVVEGCGDPQMDTYPVGLAFYQRTALWDVGAKDEDAIEEAIYGMQGAFYPECGDTIGEPISHVGEPISLSQLLANLPSPVYIPRHSSIRDMGGRRLERAIFDAAAHCAAFVALCVGEAPALTPAQALEVLGGTCEAIVKQQCEDMNDMEWDLPLGATSEYEDDDGEYLTKIGIDLIEDSVKVQLAAVAAKHAIAHAGLAAATAAGATLGLQWDASMAAVANVQDAIEAALVAHKDELAKLIDVQLRAVAGDGALDAPTVYPVSLTSSDSMQHYWSEAPQGENDHEGVQALAFVGETWALVVVAKSSSC